MKKQFKLVAEKNAEFSILRKKVVEVIVEEGEKGEEIKKITKWIEDPINTKKSLSQIALTFPKAPGVLVFLTKNNEVLKVMVSKENVRERFLTLRNEPQFSQLLELLNENGLRSVQINYAREIRI